MSSPPLTLHLVSDERLGNVTLSLCRLDLIAGPVGGNKCFKLLPNLQQARALGYRKVASFGGAWSNHLDALARVEPMNAPSPMVVVALFTPS